MKTLFKKGKKGPKCNVATLALGALLVTSAANAASNSVTVSSTLNSLFSAPAIGYISATLTSTTAVTMALPSSTKTVNSYVCQARDTNRNVVPRNFAISGTDIAVASATGQASGTLAVGDRIQCLINFER